MTAPVPLNGFDSAEQLPISTHQTVSSSSTPRMPALTPHLVGTGRSASLIVDTRGEQRSACHFHHSSPKYHCQKSGMESWYLSICKTKKQKLTNRSQGVTCFKCKPACLKTLCRVKWCCVETRGAIHLSVANTVTCFHLKNKWNYIWNKSNVLAPRGKSVFSSWRQKANWTK